MIYLIYKVVLCASSPYFAQLLSGTSPADHPVIILNDVQWSHINILVEYMYTGSVTLAPHMVETITQVADTLAIRGITKHANGSTENKSALAGRQVIMRINFNFSNEYKQIEQAYLQ